MVPSMTLVALPSLTNRDVSATPTVVVTDHDYLVCLRIYVPVGVFGFYWWFSRLVTLIFASVKVAMLMDGERKAKVGAILIAIVVAASGIVDVYASARAVDSCLYNLTGGAPGRIDHPSHVARYLWVRSTGDALIIVSGLAEVMALVKGIRWIGVVVFLAMLYHFFAAAEFYVGFTNFTHINQSFLRPILAISIPLAFVMILLLLFSCGVNEGGCCGFAGFFLVVSIVMFHTWAVGMGHMLLGQSTGDIWGSYLVKEKIGKAIAVFTPIFPILALLGIPI